jgi:type VI secretion system protein VasG
MQTKGASVNEINVETITGKLNPVGYDAFMRAFRRARSNANLYIELVHFLLPLIETDRSDIALTLDKLKLDRARVIADLNTAISRLDTNQTKMPGVSRQLFNFLDRGWYYATLQFGELQIRSGHLLIAGLKTSEIRSLFSNLSKPLGDIDPSAILAQRHDYWHGSNEENLRPMDIAAPRPGGGAERAGSTALDRFSTDLTEQARIGKIDPVSGRDGEIRQIIDILSRRRQNNPILTGEAGVGKTAVVEGFAHRIVSGDVPSHLKDIRLLSLDLGLMQAGASMRGEFEQRLRSVIDEVQSSPTPIILFIDEAHTLIGAGGSQGTGDAANLLKPALARGTLRTIGATTWAEYRQYFEKDPALTRRFQPIEVGEPDVETCCGMLRGIIDKMETHHKVRISDAAIVSAVQLSQRYIPARQLPDKAVSLLDTASARVAISQTTTPAAIEDLSKQIDAQEAERKRLANETDLGVANEKRIGTIDGNLAAARQALVDLSTRWDEEKRLVVTISEMREQLGQLRKAPDPDLETFTALTTALAEKIAQIEAIPAEFRMIYPHVDEQAVASVVADWTGIPVGRMVKDEIEAVMRLPEVLSRRVLGQDHALDMIARRIETARAKLTNPNKPIGVFMLCGPSGVGKTETALALAEALYGGEQNVITINMSEFQEAHTVSTLKGAPPGYVGYGEGGRLTEAVRRRPYSVVLLDEVEKAHPDVHELFFQVFDKGRMEDGTGRTIDFKNTLIILTSNVGTDHVMAVTQNGVRRPAPEEVAEGLRPHLLEVFPPALLGRIVTIPYYPLPPERMGDIVRLQLSHIARRMTENHEAYLTFSNAVVDHIVSLCSEIDSGGRMIDNIINNRLLPALSRRVLSAGLAGKRLSAIDVDYAENAFAFDIQVLNADEST